MSNIFNLMLLNIKDLDKHPRSWICIKGDKIKGIIAEIEEEIIKKHETNREQISRRISKEINCNFVSIKNLLRGKSKFYPIPIIIELCKISGKEKKYISIIEKS